MHTVCTTINGIVLPQACQVIESGGSFQFYDTGTQDSVKFFTTIGTEVMLDTDDTVVVAQYEAEGGGR